MLKFCSLYSGSTGNSLLVQSKNTNILIDAGVSCKKITDALENINVNVNDISAILVTHEHTDHIQGLGTLSKKYNIPVFATSKTWDNMKEQKEKISDNNIKYFNISEDFEIEDLIIKSFKTPHDAADSCGFSIINNNTKISIATDLGHIDNKIFDSLSGSKFIMLEANYEPEILKYSHYPFALKQRILGENGHLSNHIAGQTLAHLVDSGLESAILGHLSKENNFPKLAYESALEELSNYGVSKDFINLTVANRDKPSNFIEVS